LIFSVFLACAFLRRPASSFRYDLRGRPFSFVLDFSPPLSESDSFLPRSIRPASQPVYAADCFPPSFHFKWSRRPVLQGCYRRPAGGRRGPFFFFFFFFRSPRSRRVFFYYRKGFSFRGRALFFPLFFFLPRRFSSTGAEGFFGAPAIRDVFFPAFGKQGSFPPLVGRTSFTDFHTFLGGRTLLL